MHFDHEVAMRGGEFHPIQIRSRGFQRGWIHQAGAGAAAGAGGGAWASITDPVTSNRIKAFISPDYNWSAVPCASACTSGPGQLWQTGLGQAMATEYASVSGVPSASDPALAEIVRRWWMPTVQSASTCSVSVARGDAGQQRLRHLVVVADHAPAERRRSRLAYEVLWGTGVAADVLVSTASQFEGARIWPRPCRLRSFVRENSPCRMTQRCSRRCARG